MEYEIIHLPKERWKGTIIPIQYTTEEYYDVSVNRTDKGYIIEIDKKSLAKPITYSPEKYDFPDRLYEDHWANAYAWGVLIDGELIAAIETDPELWSNRLRITELWVAEEYQRQGIGHALIEVAKEQARGERRRAVILETQSCNVNAIDFYLHEGFKLIGLDTCCYKNDDLQRKEVRLEFGWFLE
ncbi:MAG: GNAT family N-acetyltransferase [Clostridiales bacterium]|nr:GNAT family N-acetyltransferase [Clostridiales bacterium]